MSPVEPAVLGVFAVAVLAVVMSPGPDTVLILRHTLASGQKAGLAAVAGVQIGLLGHTLLAVTGISLLVAASPSLFRGVALVGALYLGWLGFQALRGDGALNLATGARPATAAKALREAVLCNLLNPKVILLFLALFPNFIETGRDDVTQQLLALAATLIVVNTLWQMPLALAAGVIGRWLGRDQVRRGVSMLSGAIFLVFAIALVYEHIG